MAVENGFFQNEIVPVTVSSRKADIVVDQDEQPSKGKPEKIPMLKPAFSKEGAVTAANASSIADGAAALLLMSQSKAVELGLTPLAVIKAHSTHAHEPEKFTHAPIGAIHTLLKNITWKADEVDLFEINEAFAMVTLACMNALNLSADKVNIHGGAVSLGHPIGASGARILVTLLHALKRTGQSKGIASLCIGGGEGTALAVEML